MGEPQLKDQSAAWSRYLTDPEAIVQVFDEFRERQDEVTLRFDAVETEYVARVSSVDRRSLTLEAIRPRSGSVLMAAGRSFALSGRMGGAYLFAPGNTCASALPGDRAGAFVVALPGRLLSQQRRRGPRYPLPASLRAGRARLIVTHAGQTFEGAVEDLSAGGCRAVFEATAPDSPALEQESFDEARVEIGGLLSIGARIAVRHRSVDPTTGACTWGVEFTRVSRDDQRLLEQFLRSLSRRSAAG